MSKTLLSATGPIWLATAVVAGAAINDDSAIIDMAGYEGVVFLTTIESSDATGVATMSVEQNAANSTVGMAAAAAAVATLTSAVNGGLDGKILAVDIYRPKERYLRVNRKSATANIPFGGAATIAFGSVIAIRYGARKEPVDASQEGAMTSVSSPA